MGAHLKLKLAITGRIDVGERRTRCRQRLRVGNATRRAKNSQKLITLPVNAAEEAEFLENHAPRNHGKEQQKAQNAASDPGGLLQNLSEIDGEGCNQKKGNVRPSVQKFAGL